MIVTLVSKKAVNALRKPGVNSESVAGNARLLKGARLDMNPADASGWVRSAGSVLFVIRMINCATNAFQSIPGRVLAKGCPVFVLVIAARVKSAFRSAMNAPLAAKNPERRRAVAAAGSPAAEQDIFPAAALGMIGKININLRRDLIIPPETSVLFPEVAGLRQRKKLAGTMNLPSFAGSAT